MTKTLAASSKHPMFAGSGCLTRFCGTQDEARIALSDAQAAYAAAKSHHEDVLMAHGFSSKASTRSLKAMYAARERLVAVEQAAK